MNKKNTMIMNNSLLFLLAVLVSTTAADYTGSAAKLYVSEISGRFSNEHSLNHMDEEGYLTNLNLIKMSIHPLNNIPELNTNFVLYFLEWISGQFTRQQILAVKGEGDFFELQPYEFVHPESFVPGTFNISSLESLTLNDLQFKEECKALFERASETSLVADWPDCTGDTVPRYMIKYNCNSLTFFMYNETLQETKSKVPYSLSKVESFPVPASVMPDYEMYKSLCNY